MRPILREVGTWLAQHLLAPWPWQRTVGSVPSWLHRMLLNVVRAPIGHPSDCLEKRSGCLDIALQRDFEVIGESPYSSQLSPRRHQCKFVSLKSVRPGQSMGTMVSLEYPPFYHPQMRLKKRL